MELCKMILMLCVGTCALAHASSAPQQAAATAPQSGRNSIPARRFFRDNSDEFDSHERLREVTANIAATNAAARFAGPNAASQNAPSNVRTSGVVQDSRSSSRFHHSLEDNWSYEDDDAKYDFNWDVSDEETHFERHEAREGHSTTGSYSVMLPDGRKQVVTYYVDGPSGYVAKVRYEGTATAGPGRHSEESLEDFD